MKPIRLKDAAIKYNIPEKTLYSWHSKGIFPRILFKIAGLVMFDEDEYLKHCEAQVEAQAPAPEEKKSFIERAREAKRKRDKSTK